ncbi:hypothetical protein ASG63_02345 [Methylobacterium sp. Leaf94]|uniref:hypothetical protein n=1 Tax=Methylobacterium sp. Leaf94 TaxID=1736250 RepID=UPI0006FBAC6E|nr:hypothetical protein [Methylobacterium sp. Leaf94]KQU27491.1 hypothetical protein ASG63_02345 [Methylobacterium sp. Leaf94]
MSLPVRAARRRPALVLAALLPLAACGPRAGIPTPAATAPLRERLAAFALGQAAFGAVSLIPVRFAHSRVSQPFQDAGRTLYCLSSRMTGRTFGRAERPKIVVQEAGGVLTRVDEDPEICEGHRTEPLPELEALAAGRG